MATLIIEKPNLRPCFALKAKQGLFFYKIYHHFWFEGTSPEVRWGEGGCG